MSNEFKLVPVALLERLCMRPAKELLAVNNRDIIDRGQAQAEMRELLTTPQPPAIGDWAIDESAGRPILTYKGCSVIEAEDAASVTRTARSAKVVLPEKADYRIGSHDAQRGWDNCIDAVKKLNNQPS